MSDYKTNFFGSFLDTMKTPSAPLQSAEHPAAPQGVADAVLQLLHDRQGPAKIEDLLPLTGFSVTALVDTINNLGSFGLVKREGNIVELTAAGTAVAAGVAAAAARLRLAAAGIRRPA